MLSLPSSTFPTRTRGTKVGLSISTWWSSTFLVLTSDCAITATPLTSIMMIMMIYLFISKGKSSDNFGKMALNTAIFNYY